VPGSKRLESRVLRVEFRFRPRCARCRRELACSFCRFGYDLEAMTAAELQQMVLSGLKEQRQRDPASFFGSAGFDLNRLTVEELHVLRVLLRKADPEGDPDGERHAGERR
jgi:hypothetical protein